MRAGDVVLTNQIVARDRPVRPNYQASFKPPKGSSIVVLVLGHTDGSDEFDPEKVLNNLGWVRAEQKGGPERG